MPMDCSAKVQTKRLVITTENIFDSIEISIFWQDEIADKSNSSIA
jgi:hypothetical protein